MADTKISNLTPLANIDGNEEFVVAKNGGNNKLTAAQIKTFVEEGMSVDAYTKEETNNLLAEKQDTLEAGDNITIEGNRISATGGGGGSTPIVQELGDRTDAVISQAVVSENFNKIFDELFPTTSSFSSSGSLFLIGSTPTVTLSWSLRREGQTITPDTVTLNGNAITGTSTTVRPTANTTYTLVQTLDGVEYRNTTSVSFSNNNYYGILTAEAPTSAQVSALTGVLDSNRAYNATYTGTQTRAVYAYPASYGNLTSILDPNGFQNIDAFNRTEMSITNAVGDAVTYNVYTAKELSNYSSFTFRFS